MVIYLILSNEKKINKIIKYVIQVKNVDINPIQNLPILTFL